MMRISSVPLLAVRSSTAKMAEAAWLKASGVSQPRIRAEQLQRLAEDKEAEDEEKVGVIRQELADRSKDAAKRRKAKAKKKHAKKKRGGTAVANFESVAEAIL